MMKQPLAPALPDDRAGPRWGLLASLVVHALMVAALGLTLRPTLPDGGAAPSYEFVFDQPPGGAPPADPARTQQLPPPQPADITPPPDAALGTPAPEPLSQPDPAATGAPPPAESVPPAPAPPVPAPTPEPPQEAPAEPEAPAVRLQAPPIEAAPTAPDAIMPEPPPPLPPVQQPPPPRPVARPAPRSPFGTLSNPMDLSLAPSRPRPAARGSVASRAIDLSPPPERTGPLHSDPYADIRAANASADWNRGLLQYWLRHRYYPEQAAANGEEGSVTLQLTVNRSGKVENVEILSRSGSQWLDMAALGTWRNARLPPFTNEMREDRITFPIPIRYYLVR